MTAPELSVIVPAVTGMKALAACLNSLGRQREAPSLEILVPNRLDEEGVAQLAAGHASVRTWTVAADCPLMSMRSEGFLKAQGAVVAVIEDHLVLPETWARTLVTAVTSSDGVAGGVIVNGARDNLVERAAFLCEYSACMPPVPGGFVPWIVGNNTGYRRDILMKVKALWQDSAWEDRLHSGLQEQGTRLWCEPALVAEHHLHVGFREYMGLRFHYSRAFAAHLAADKRPSAAFWRGVLCFALPPVLLLRLIHRVWKKGKGTDRRTLIYSMPILVLFVLSWATGELFGNWCGAGSSPTRIR